MTLNLCEIADAVARYGPVMRIVVARVRGSAPREAGASMLVWPGGQSGTIGGGALEFDAATRALEGAFAIEVPLGPGLGQCCGGSVSLVAERWTKQRLTRGSALALRRISGEANCPMALRQAARDQRSGAQQSGVLFAQGWLFEPLVTPRHALWIYGAGHVGRAIVDVMAPLPNVSITWVDTGANRFPDHTHPNVTALPAANPADSVPLAPASAAHLVLTYSHALDLELCHRLLSHRFDFAGLIGSATKWARFRSRLKALGHSAERIASLTCPIGDPTMGKHPHQIALSVASQLSQNWAQRPNALEMTA